MENISRPVIVPWDFTQISMNAYEHAVNLASILKKEIVLLHIVRDVTDIDNSFEKLKAKAIELQNEFKITTHPIIKSGNIFDTVKVFADESKAEMVVMGTHGVKGWQKFFGSNALKMVAKSKIPFVIIQEKPLTGKFDNIIFPIDFRKENKEQVNYINYLSSNFGSKFLVFKRLASDRGFKKRIASNLHFVESFFKMNNINYEIFSATNKLSFEKEVVQFAKEMNSELIIVLTTRDLGFVDYLIAAKEQSIIANSEKIPVMCINPKPAKLASGFRAAGG
jgi:nucleotide-binding universal stress UspA family protein